MEEGWYSGSLKDLALAQVLRRLQMSTKTGILEVEQDAYIVNIFIKNGDVIFATSNNDEDRLGELLLREEKISFDEYNQANSLFHKRRERMGRIFVELGCLNPKEVFLAVRHQIEEIVLNLFSVEVGRYEFREGSLLADELITLHMSSSSIIYRGIKRIKNVLLVRSICPPADGVLELSRNPLNLFQELNLEDPDKIVLSYIKGNKLKTILSLSPTYDFDTMKTICGLMIVGLVINQGEDESPALVTADDLLKEPEDGISENFVVEIEDMLQRCDSSDCYGILGLTAGVSEEDIRRAYYRLSQRFHPDRHFSLPTHDIKKRLIRIYSYITHACEVLIDPDRRREYDRDPSLVKETAPDEITDSSFTTLGIPVPKRAPGEAAERIPGEAAEEAVHVEEAGAAAGVETVCEAVEEIREMPAEQKTASVYESDEIIPDMAQEPEGEVPGESADDGIHVEETGFAEGQDTVPEAAAEETEAVPSGRADTGVPDRGPAPVAAEAPERKSRGKMMPVAVILIVVAVVAAVVSLTYKGRQKESVAPGTPPAAVETETADRSKGVSIRLPAFREDLFRRILNESGEQK